MTTTDKCKTKGNHKPYSTRNQAAKQMAYLIGKLIERGDESWRTLNVFQCGKHWHFGNRNPWTPSKRTIEERRQAKAIIRRQRADFAESERFAHRMVDEIFNRIRPA